METDNWTLLVEEYYELIGRVYQRVSTGEKYRFFGLVYGDDDLYYGMNGIDGAGLLLLSCVGSITGHGFVLDTEFEEVRCPYCNKDSLTLISYSDKFGPNGILVEDLSAYECRAGCVTQYETPQQYRDRCDKIKQAYNAGGA